MRPSKSATLHKTSQCTRSSRSIALGFESLEDRRVLATIPVTLNADAPMPSGADGGITLREAITYVNTQSVPQGDRNLGLFDVNDLGTNDKITFDSSLNGTTIKLGVDANGQPLDFEFITAELSITESVVIDGLDEAGQPRDITITITPEFPHDSRIFNINDNDPFTAQDVFIKGLTLTGGNPGNTTGGAIGHPPAVPRRRAA